MKSKTKCTRLLSINKEGRRPQIWLHENSKKYLGIWKGQRGGQEMTRDKGVWWYLTEVSGMCAPRLDFRSGSLPCRAIRLSAAVSV